MRIGIFGGTFDPLHVGHLVVAEEAKTFLGLDQVIFIPAGEPWLKRGKEITEASQRMAMVELGVASNPSFVASNIEVTRPGPSYTVDTLEELQGKLDLSAKMFVILGLDALSDLNEWRRPERIISMSILVGVPRPGSEEFDPVTIDRICSGASKNLALLPGPLIGISGTDLRRRVSQGLSIKYQVPSHVEQYINEHQLYMT